MPYVRPNKEQHIYVLGIDFGHSETSVDLCSIQWDDRYLKLMSPESIEIFNGVRAIKSVLLVEKKESENDCYYIGQQAVARFSNPKFHTDDVEFDFYSYFKKVPSLMSEKDRDVMRIYMQEVYRQIRRQRSELNDNNHLVYIACPSNSTIWTEKEINNYAEIASEAGLPLVEIDDNNRGVIRESIAAFLKAVSISPFKSSLKEGTLLIDFGSSSVCLTYYTSIHTDKSINFEYDCGASRVEKDIIDDLMNKFPEFSAAISYSSSAQAAILAAVRDAKENFYMGYDYEDFEVYLNLRKFTNGTINKSIEYFYSDNEIKTILKKYADDIKNAFESFRDKYLIDKPVKLIFLTGGASRMDFIKEIVRSVFDSNIDFLMDINPAVTISNGITLAGRSDLRAFFLEEDIDHFIISHADIANKTIEATVSILAKNMVNEIYHCISIFASRSDDSLSSLENDIKQSVRSISVSSYLQSSYDTALKNISNTRVIPDINKIVTDYFHFRVEPIIGSTSFYLNIKTDVVDKFSYTILNGLFFKLNIDLNNLCLDLRRHFFVFINKNTPLSMSMRAMVKNVFDVRKSSYISSLRSDFIKILEAEKELVNIINTSGRKEIKKHIHEQVQNARFVFI